MNHSEEYRKLYLGDAQKQAYEAKQLFIKYWGGLPLESLKEQKEILLHTDMSQFELVLDYAKDLREKALKKINQCIYMKERN